ncbi:MAG: 50S ribosomal protein L1 [Nanoarchaeota archaeon]|nr:50S ribosomal protein L1 [Nanoarchaeota archaeon]
MIDKKDIIPKLSEALDKGKKRKFSQSYDLSIGLKGIDFKNPASAIEDVVILPHERGKKITICGLVDKDMQTAAKAAFDKVVMKDDFSKFLANKKSAQKIADECDFFVAQANIMGEVAKNFGRVFGPRGKMPNPKASCVVPSNAKLDVLIERLRKTVVLKAKKAPAINVRVGTDKQKPEQIADNIHVILESLIKHLPNGEQNIKNVYIKTTMGSSVKLM